MAGEQDGALTILRIPKPMKPMKLNKAALILACLLTTTAYAEPYPRLDPNSLINGSPDNPPITVNIAALQNALQNLGDHAGDYPPRFDSDADRAQAIKDLAPLAILLEDMTKNSAASGKKDNEAHLASLQMSARLYWIGHNLDQPGYAEKAHNAYIQLLKLAPKNRKAEVEDELGRFLASVGKGDEAVQHLRNAYKSGYTDSGFPLGMTLLIQGQKEEAIRILQDYAQKNPNDPRPQQVLEAVNSGQFEIRRE